MIVIGLGTYEKANKNDLTVPKFKRLRQIHAMVELKDIQIVLSLVKH